jgi:hypothetical protein
MQQKRKEGICCVGSRWVLLNQNCDSLVIYFLFEILSISYCRAIVIAPIKETRRIRKMSSNGR